MIVFGQESAADSEKEQEIEFLSSFSETPTVIPLSESQKLDPSFTEVVEVGKTLPLYTRDHEVE